MAEGDTRSLFAGILRLVPYSGIQFHDVAILQAATAGVSAHFIEEIFETDGIPHRILLPLDGRVEERKTKPSDTDTPLRVAHPVTGKPIDPARVLEISATEALGQFAGDWIPLPYLRFIGRDDQQRPRFDSGPTNWVRGWIAPPAPEKSSMSITLAFDTSLERNSRLDTAVYGAPNADDAAFGSTFVCAESVDDLGPLLAEPWLDAWLSRTSPAQGSTASSGAVEFRHRHIACYLTLLRLLAQTAAMPEARFTDTIQRRYPIRTVSVDLVLDIGDNESTALLAEATPNDQLRGSASGFAELLRMRDLSAPHLIHDGPIPTVAEFNAPPLGNSMLSRQSGRHDAFNWPSLVRIGREGRRHSLRSNGTEGVTGLSNLGLFLLDDAASPGVWRQSTEDAHATEQGPMVTGLMLSHLSEAGTLLAPEAPGAQAPAIRPRFSRASMLALFACELVLHALAQVNAATPELGGENEVRELRQVIVLAPPTLSAGERDALLGRVNAGVALAWRGLGWERGPSAGVPTRPAVRLGLGGNLATQIAFLHDEISTRYQGRFGDFLRVYQNGSEGNAQRLRVASAEVSARTTTFAIVDYTIVEDPLTSAEWVPNLHRTERLPVGTDAAIQAIIWSIVLPAIEQGLDAAGLYPARRFLDEITGRSTTSLLIDDPYFIRRFNRKVLWPAARALLDLDAEAAASASYGNRAVSLATLVALGDGRLDGVSGIFDAAALAAGAPDFSLAETRIPLGRGRLASLISHEMREVSGELSRLVQGENCDLFLLAGDGMRLPSLRDALVAAIPLAPSRIVDLAVRPNRTGVEALGGTVPMISATLMPAIAAALQQRDTLATSGFSAGTLRRLGRRTADGVSDDAPRALPAPVTLPAHASGMPAPGKGA